MIINPILYIFFTVDWDFDCMPGLLLQFNVRGYPKVVYMF